MFCMDKTCNNSVMEKGLTQFSPLSKHSPSARKRSPFSEPENSQRDDTPAGREKRRKDKQRGGEARSRKQNRTVTERERSCSRMRDESKDGGGAAERRLITVIRGMFAARQNRKRPSIRRFTGSLIRIRVMSQRGEREKRHIFLARIITDLSLPDPLSPPILCPPPSSSTRTMSASSNFLTRNHYIVHVTCVQGSKVCSGTSNSMAIFIHGQKCEHCVQCCTEAAAPFSLLRPHVLPVQIHVDI